MDQPVKRFERQSLMEWMIIRRRVLIVVLILLATVAGSAIGILYAVGVEGLSKQQLRHFAHQSRLYPHGGVQGPIIERVPRE